MELPATQAMDDELPPTQPFVNDEETDDSPVGTLIVDKTSYPILRGLTSIGRHPQCKVFINDATVSGNHAAIEAETSNRAIFIKDLGSTNKTKLNDTRLRPHSLYQIKDGDKLCFGSIIATFKLFQPVDESLISCTPQINNKVRSVIPGTPDSMNASSASEGDVSIIPGTQNDVGTCFRRPETPSKTSTISDHSSPGVPAFNMDDFENSIYSAETQKSSESKPDDTDESIYELETQRPSDVEKDKNSIEDLETQRCDPKLLNSTNNKSHNVSIYSAETQKQMPEKDVSEDGNNIEDLETQRFDPKLLNNTNNKSHDVSIYSAETQKQSLEKDVSEDRNNIEDLETQRFDPKLLNSTNNKSHNVSIYSAETQKQSLEKDVSEDRNNIEDLETQRFDPKLLNNTSIYSAETQKQLSEDDINNSVRKSVDVSIYSAETQKVVSEGDTLENLETQQFIVNKADSSVRKSTEASIYCAETQKVVPGVNVDESIENMETQRIDIRTSHIFQTPNLPKTKSVQVPLSEMETQKYDPDSLLANDVSLEDAETERFECEKSDLEKRKSEKLTPKKKSETEMLHEAETQKYLPDTCNKISKGDESIDDLETQQFISNISNVVINESTDNMDSQEPAKPTSIEDMETMPFDKEVPPLDQCNQHVDKSAEATNNRDINDQSKTVHSEKIKSSLQDDSSINDQSDTVQSEKDNSSLQDNSINNIDTSKSAEHDDVEDEMFSQNLIEDCPFAFLPEESQENIGQEIDASKGSKDLEQENKSITKDDISQLSVEIDKKSNISNDKKLASSVDSDSETDEEGFFSNPTPTENSTKSNVEKSNSDSETDEEGVFSSHMLKESENSEISAKSKCNDNPETDEGVFSNPSKSNEKLNSENNETDSDTDKEGTFSNNLSKRSEVNEKEAENNKNVSTTRNDTSKMDEDEILDNSLETTNKTKEENNKSRSEPSKVQSLSFKRNSLISHSPIPDSDDSLFDDNDDYEKSNLNTSEKSSLQVNKSFNKINNISTSKDNQSTSNEDVKKMDSETNQKSSANESMNVTKDKNSEVDDLAPTQVIDTSKTVIDESDTEDEFLAPTQVISPKKVPTNIDDKDKTNLQVINPTNINNKEDDFLEPTQPMERGKSPIKPDTEKFEDLVLSPTQKIETQDCTELMSSTENVKNSSNRESNQIDRNGSVEDLDYEMAPTQPVEDKISKESINTSKRHLEELEITCNKKLKSDDVRSVDVDSNIEKNLVQMFEGPEEDKVVNQGPELLTQQLEDILQSSQVEEDPTENIIVSVPSPTLGSNRKNSKAKNRRKGVHLKNANTSSQEKKVNIDLNDTIERNLKDIFNSSVNDVESYESDSLLTQQLANILESQDNSDLKEEDTKIKVSPTLSTRKSRSSSNAPSSSKSKDKRKSIGEVNEEDTKIKASPLLSTRVSRSSSNAPSSSKGKDKRKSNVLARSRVSPVKEEPKSEKTEESAEESQGTEEYFANLKSKKKRASAFLDTQSQEEPTSDSEKELVYKHGIVGFVDGIGAIRTSKRVPLREPKGIPFTSDSQSDSEEPDSSQRKKRFSLSLSKNVDLNSSLSDYDLETTTTKTRSGKEVKQKRVLAKGTRGFERGSPVESEELVSAPSTEGEEEIGSSQQKVGNLHSSLRLSLDMESEARMSQPVDSDEEFLKSMPDIKVAGTADCLPTSSQLAAPCDDDFDDTISLRSVSIPVKNQLYAHNRFDHIYKRPAAATANAPSDDDAGEEKAAAAPLLESPLTERNDVASTDIEEFIEKLGRKRPGDATPRGTPASASRSSRAGKRRRGSASPRTPSGRPGTASPRTPSGRPGTRSSSNLGVEQVRRHSFAKEANKTLTSSSDSDSEGTYVGSIVRKYKPSEESKNFKREMWAFTHAKSAADYEPDENDLEFARLREEFERNLSKSTKTARTAAAAAPKQSPAGARGRRACALTGGTLSGSRTSTTSTTRTRAKAGNAYEDASLFQVPSSAGGADRGARRQPPLAITRSKRLAAEDSQNQPPKRAKTQNDHVKQELLVVISPIRDKLILYRSQQALRTIDNNGTNAFRQNTNDQPKKAEKNLIKFPKPLESYVVLQRTKRKVDNLESLSRSNDKALQNKGESEIKSTSRRNKAAANESTKAETSITKGLSSSKDSVLVEDSDAESCKQTSTRGTRSRRNKDANSSVAKNNSKDESSGNSSEDANKSAKSTRGKTVRQSQKKAAPIKNKTIIPDSDQESDESMSKSKEEKTVHQADSNKKEETKKSTSKSSRSRRVKHSDTEKLEDSEISVNTTTRSRRIKKATSKIISSQDSDSEFSGEINSISKNVIKSKKNVKDKKVSDSERSTSPEKNNKSDIPAETKTRSTRRAKAQDSSNSVFSESDNDQSKNSSVANASKSSRSVRPTRKRAATTAIPSESQEEAEFKSSSSEKDTNAKSRTRKGRTTKKTNASSSSSSQSLKGGDSQTDDTSDKSADRSKRAKVNMTAKNTRCSRSPTPSQSLLTPSRSRRSSLLSPLRGSKHKVLFTGDKSEAHKNIVSKLGATVIDDPGKCTILVTDKVRRTCKFLCCVARGIPIVSFKWLDESLKAQHFVDWEDYILEDPASEAQYKFNLQESLEKARKQQFLEGYTVLFSQIPAKLLSTKELKDIVASSGGKALFRAPTKWPEKIVIVTTEDKLLNAKKLIAKAPKSITIHTTEFLFTGILRQEVNLQEFKLFS